MVWGKAGSTTLTTTGDTITVSGTTASDFNQTLSHVIQTTSNIRMATRVGNGSIDTGSNYANRSSENGTSEATATSQTYHKNSGSVPSDMFAINYAVNIATEEKLFISHNVVRSTAGAGNAPQRMESVGKWANTSDQFNYIETVNDQAGDYTTDSNLSVLGSDITPAAAITFPTNVQVGSRAEITDTRKMYNFTELSDISIDGDYTVIQFKENGTFTPTSSFDVEYLVVAGGGGGGDSFSKQAGGGGAGGYLAGTGHGVTAQTYNITVGTGGAGSTSTTANGTNGTNSTFSSFTAIGGGGGGKGGDGAQANQNGNSGGSGGGGGGSGFPNNGGSGGSATSGQGYAGGAGNKSASTGGSNSGNGRAGGGGGSSQVGRDGATDSTGNFGGAGTSNSITGTAYTYAAGGEGGANHNQNAHDNGKFYGDGGSGDSGNGANGIVILRFLTSGNTYTTSLTPSYAWQEIGA